MKITINKSVIGFLRCPYDRTHQLSRMHNGFRCEICNMKYPSRFVDGVEIPDFLIEKHTWVQGFRGLNNKVIGIFQVDKPIKKYSGSGKWVMDVGCGEYPRGNINIDCYVPASIPENFILANAEYLPFNDKSVDVVLSYYNIEHLINPANYILTVSSIAKRKVGIVTDNSEWLGDIFFRIIGAGRIFHDEHTFKWSQEYMMNLLRRLGIKHAKVTLLNLSTTPLVNLVSLLGRIPRIGNIFYRDLRVEISI